MFTGIKQNIIMLFDPHETGDGNEVAPQKVILTTVLPRYIVPRYNATPAYCLK